MQSEGRDQHALHFGQAALAGQMTEQLIHVRGDLGIGREVTDVGVQRSGAAVVVARGQMAVAAQHTAFTAGDQQHFGVCLQAHDAVDHLGTNRFELLGPVDVGLFVKTGFELHHRGDFFAPAHRLAQQIHHGGVAASAVNGLFDGQYVRVHHRFAQKGEHTVEAFKRLVDQHITFFQPVEHRAVLRQLHREAGFEGGK